MGGDFAGGNAVGDDGAGGEDITAVQQSQERQEQKQGKGTVAVHENDLRAMKIQGADVVPRRRWHAGDCVTTNRPSRAGG